MLQNQFFVILLDSRLLRISVTFKKLELEITIRFLGSPSNLVEEL